MPNRMRSCFRCYLKHPIKHIYLGRAACGSCRTRTSAKSFAASTMQRRRFLFRIMMLSEQAPARRRISNSPTVRRMRGASLRSQNDGGLFNPIRGRTQSTWIVLKMGCFVGHFRISRRGLPILISHFSYRNGGISNPNLETDADCSQATRPPTSEVLNGYGLTTRLSE